MLTWESADSQDPPWYNTLVRTKRAECPCCPVPCLTCWQMEM